MFPNFKHGLGFSMKLKASGGVDDITAAGSLFPVLLHGLVLARNVLAEAPGGGSGMWLVMLANGSSLPAVLCPFIASHTGGFPVEAG